MRTIKKIFKGMSKERLKQEISTIEEGCGKKVDSEGDCFYISSRGNLRLCSSCSRTLKIAKEVLGTKR